MRTVGHLIPSTAAPLPLGRQKLSLPLTTSSLRQLSPKYHIGNRHCVTGTTRFAYCSRQASPKTIPCALQGKKRVIKKPSMSDRWKRKKTVFKSLLASTVRLSACASYGSNALKPGISLLPEVIATMCMPAMNWKYQDDQEQLAYPSGP